MRKTSKLNRSTRKIAAAVTVPLVTAAALAVTAPPASAATTKCSGYQYRTGPVVTQVAVKTCVVASGSSRYAYILVEWARAYGGTDWDLFKVHARLERNDGNYATKWCDFTDSMNRYQNGRLTCRTATVSSSVSGGWTGDGIVNFNINLDGLGTKTWELGGSPSVS
ncbi:hypothetical protein [Actinomadura alba]|uniref:Secreted protein n=1 Tax=Actinomadura alba TaxID=406431 RepID=A0ABR7LMS6_9ACTN|nr:hypothetical protein [Actinomadura alba]MBC6465805.1 hypothetical protein [Actinomadura alba]